MTKVAESLPIIFGEYALIERLGQGAVGEVFLARPLDGRRALPSPLVIKRLHEKHTSDDELVRRFRHEAELAVYVDSPFIAKVYEVGQIGNSLYIAMEYVAGLALNHFLSALVIGKRFPPIPIAVQIASDALCALDILHNSRDRAGKALGFVHRDISPKNLMLGDDGMLRLIDLGFAKSQVQDWKTATGVVMGSLGYMPPEQIQAVEVDARADLYAIGVVLFELLTVRRFIRPESIAEMVKATLSEPRTPASHYRPDIPPELDEILRRATARDRNERYATARDFHDALVEAVPARPTREQLRSFIERAKDDKQRVRAVQIAQLLQEPLPSQSGEEDSIKTTVYVERTFVERTLLLHAADPTAILPPRPPVPRRWPTFALVFAALIVGLFAGMRLAEKPAVPITIAPVPRREVPEVMVRAVEQAAEESEVGGSVEPDVTLGPGQGPGPGRTRSVEKVAKTLPDRKDRSGQPLDVAGLTAKMNARLAGLPAGDPLAKKIEALLFDLTMVRSMKDPERVASEVARLNAALEGLVATP